jgi:hypothetical protein
MIVRNRRDRADVGLFGFRTTQNLVCPTGEGGGHPQLVPPGHQLLAIRFADSRAEGRLEQGTKESPNGGAYAGAGQHEPG